MKTKMKFSLLMITVLSIATIVTGCSSKENTKNVVDNTYADNVASITVGGKNLNPEEYDFRLNKISEFFNNMDYNFSTLKNVQEYAYHSIKTSMINEEVIKQFATNNNIIATKEEIEEYGEQLGLSQKDIYNKYYKKQLEADILKDKILYELSSKEEIKDEEVQEYYNQNIDYFKIGERIKARFIILSDKKTADQVYLLLKEGKDFKELAKEYSIDESSAEVGGDVGEFEIKQMFPDSKDFQDKVSNAKVGEYTEVIDTGMGTYLIVKVEKKIPPETMEFDLIKEALKEQMLQQKGAEEGEKIFERMENSIEVIDPNK